MTKVTQRGIGKRIITLVLVSITLSVLLLAAGFMTVQFRQAIDDKRASVQTTGYILASVIADDLATGNRSGVLDALRSIRRIPDIRRAIAIAPDGTEVASIGSAWMLESDVAGKETGLISTLMRGWFPVVTDVVKGGQPGGRLIIIADISGLRGQVAAILAATLAAALFTACIGVAAAIRLSRRISGPLVLLTQTIQKIREGRNYTSRVETDATDETGVLVEAFNGMMAEIGYRDESMRRLAYHDALTGLGNRQEFQRRMQDALHASSRNNTGAALVLLDLDQFKSVNDTYGHSVGDGLLMEVASRFANDLPDGASLSRLGGDEFALIVANITCDDDVHRALAPLFASLYRPIMLMGRDIEIGVSAGVAIAPHDGMAIADLLRRADLALYSAKHDGRGRMHFFRPTLEEDMQAATELGHDLRLAISGQQLEAHYQPQVDLLSGKVIGFESLLRWKHPVRGYISPTIFIPIAEKSAIICDLGDWILQESCRQAQIWREHGFDCWKISVNISVGQIRQPGFPDRIAEVLADTGLPASALCLELTESMFAGVSLDWVRKVFADLKSLGVSLALDDFGTGYSSMSYLQEMPFDTLKIDRAFVKNAHASENKQGLLKGIIDLGHALSMMIVAEGAEIQDEVRLLRAMAADQVQGYAFAKPQPAEDAYRTALALNQRSVCRIRSIRTEYTT